MPFKMSSEEMKLLSLLASVTGTLAKDCIIDNNHERIIFVVNRVDTGRVIGKGGETIRRLRGQMSREIDVVAYDNTAEQFLINTLSPAKVDKVEIYESKGKKYASVMVKRKERGKAIGRGGRTLDRARLLMRRHFAIENISLK